MTKEYNVTLIGSARFSEHFFKLKDSLDLLGFTVNIPGVIISGKEKGKYEFSKEELTEMIEIHRENIRNSDFVILISLEGYLGSDTYKDLVFARKHGKLILEHSIYNTLL